jgi:hydrogenase maturation protein HypF
MSGLDTLALGGGCFLNGLVSTHLRAALLANGLRVLEAERLPPNDGGLSLGQAWVAMRVHEQPARLLGRSSNEAVATQ